MDLKKRAIGLIISFGLVSLFGDIVYEGARSVNGPYLKLLAVNAAALGVISGLGEFLGYALRLLSGYSTRQGIIGLYIFRICFARKHASAVLTGVWQTAASL